MTENKNNANLIDEFVGIQPNCEAVSSGIQSGAQGNLKNSETNKNVNLKVNNIDEKYELEQKWSKETDNMIFRNVSDDSLYSKSSEDEQLSDGELPPSPGDSSAFGSYPRSPKKLAHIPQEKPETNNKHKENTTWTDVMNEFDVEGKVDNTKLNDNHKNPCNRYKRRKWIDMDKPYNHEMSDKNKDEKEKYERIAIQEIFLKASNKIKKSQHEAQLAGSHSNQRRNSLKDEYLDDNHISNHKSQSSSKQRNAERYDSKDPRKYGSRECSNYRSRKDCSRDKRHYQSSSKRGSDNGELSVHDRLGYKPSVHSRISFANRVNDPISNESNEDIHNSNTEPRAGNKRKFDEYNPRGDDDEYRDTNEVRCGNESGDEVDPKNKDVPRDEDGREVKKHVKDRIGFKRDPTLCFNEESDIETMAKEMAKVLGEKEEYIIIFERIIEVLGRVKTMELYDDFDIIYKNGGLLMQNSTKKRSKGGVFFNLFKAAVGEDEYIYAFEEFKKLQKQKKKLEREKREQKKFMKEMENLVCPETENI